MTVRSVRDLGWAVVLNSNTYFTSPGSLSVAIVKDDAASPLRESGTTNISQYFRVGSVIQVTGEVEELKDKRTGKPYHEIKVRSADQIKKR
jgi:hypothetical protein